MRENDVTPSNVIEMKIFSDGFDNMTNADSQVDTNLGNIPTGTIRTEPLPAGRNRKSQLAVQLVKRGVFSLLMAKVRVDAKSENASGSQN